MEDEMKAKEDLEKNCGGRGEGRRMDVGSAEEDGPEASPMAGCGCGPARDDPQGAKRNKSKSGCLLPLGLIFHMQHRSHDLLSDAAVVTSSPG